MAGPPAGPVEPDATLRARAAPGGVRVSGRGYSLEASGRAGWSDDAERPSALDLLLAALATDLLEGLACESRREDLAIHDAELRLQAWLEAPLVVAGVVGECGRAGLRAIRGSLYLDTDADPAALQRLEARIRERAPVLASLEAGVPFTLQIHAVS